MVMAAHSSSKKDEGSNAVFMRFLVSRRASVLMACALGVAVFYCSIIVASSSSGNNSSSSMHLLWARAQLTHVAPYPRWGGEMERISHEKVLQAVSAMQHFRATTTPTSESNEPMTISEQVVYMVTPPHSDDAKAAILYKAPTPRGVIRPQAILLRMQLMEDFMVKALTAFLRQQQRANDNGDQHAHAHAVDTSRPNHLTTKEEFPHLRAALEDQGSTGFGGAGFIFILDYEDPIFCLDEDPINLLHAVEPNEANANLATGTTTARTTNTNTTTTTALDYLPMFTLSAPISNNCQYTFPVPNYQSISWLSSQHDISYWWHNTAWRRKYNKAVWRGSPTGQWLDEDLGGGRYHNLRVRLCDLASRHPDLLDARLTGNVDVVPIPEAAHLYGSYMEMPKMQHYKAILDMDGNSWSSRFGQLLCTSSVILKVDPTYVDYFYPELRPYEHFIPVQADLSDLVQQTKFALARKNERYVRNIVANANAWCREKLTTSQLQHDTLAVWDEYLRRMDGPFFSSSSSSSSSAEQFVKEYQLEQVVVGGR